ncbi:lysM and putative peptidoglycan-binding domain-containing protein 1-like [Planoprotostelium fungivorum]|uniref:LysM and putative peptidoglycan-binding domain-containing protein 1-like n=1 Tax=Planoprotostelium fungivorum TaxID=1890364 RepID=A0A2P6NKU6_9EUKA|nr:lysM and putative peptidoglycan-binding domain-containing protein 1-like [Planoprotostelium fungivorum]
MTDDNHTAIFIRTSKDVLRENEQYVQSSLALKPSPPNLRRSCLRCKKLYLPASNEPCRYHSGRYVAKSKFEVSSILAERIWTCCQQLNRNAEGCSAGHHKEDEQASALLRNFDVIYENASESERLAYESTLKTSPIITQPKKVEPKEPPSSFVLPTKHTVVKGDNLTGISVKYGVPIDMIKRANRLMGNVLWEKTVLTIPDPQAQTATITSPAVTKNIEEV